MRKEYEERLIRYASDIVTLKQYINSSYEGDHLGKQLIRSGTSVALNFGEVQSAQSKKDFIHKQSIVLKELRESHINLRIIKLNNLCKNMTLLLKLVDESDQLIRILTKSIQTTKKNI
jgi:four helix bundle protein